MSCVQVVRIESNHRDFGSMFLVPSAELASGLLLLRPSGSLLPTIPGLFLSVDPVSSYSGRPFSLRPFIYRPFYS